MGYWQKRLKKDDRKEVEADISASRNARSRMKFQIHHSRRLYLWE